MGFRFCFKVGLMVVGICFVGCIWLVQCFCCRGLLGCLFYVLIVCYVFMFLDEYCQQKVVVSGFSFYYSFLFLLLQCWLVIMVLYVFCCEVDDIVDEIEDVMVVCIKFMWWCKEIVVMFEGQFMYLVIKVLYLYVVIYQLKGEYL